MHDTARDIGRSFFETYFERRPIAVLEVGSMNINGSLRELAPPSSIYTGVDLSPGLGVDIVLEDPNTFPFEDERFDAVVSSSCFEHDPMFWVTFLEVVRVAKTGGYVYINAPSNGQYHAYPSDNWRFYPDASLALANWARLQGHEIELIESFIARRKADEWNDCVMVFRKGQGGHTIPRRVVDTFPGSYNVRRGATESVENFVSASEDRQLLDESKGLLAASEREVARLTAELKSLHQKLGSRGADEPGNLRWIGFDH